LSIKHLDVLFDSNRFLSILKNINGFGKQQDTR
jgi:hypothetical protein